jgi:hypothetical protein
MWDRVPILAGQAIELAIVVEARHDNRLNTKSGGK